MQQNGRVFGIMGAAVVIIIAAVLVLQRTGAPASTPVFSQAAVAMTQTAQTFIPMVVSEKPTGVAIATTTATVSVTVTTNATAQVTPSTTTPVTTITAATPVIPPTDEASTRIQAQPGFAIRIFADGLSAPRFMTIGPDGVIYISLTGAGQIARLPDTNHDGLADSTTAVASGLSSPHGLEWHDGWLYVAELGRISRLRDSDNNGSLDTRETVTENIPGAGGHSSRTLHFGPDGKLYVSAGSSSNNTPEDDPRRAAIMRFNPDGTIPSDNPYVSDSDTRKQPVWALGLRNSVDFIWTPNNELWADHNGSDGLGDDLPPEEIVIPVQKNGHYGWPYCYTPPPVGQNTSAHEVRDERVGLPEGFSCDQVTPALFTDLAHSAPLGMSFGKGSIFPSEYQDDLFVAFHGSWNTDNVNNYRDCKVQRIVVENGQPVRSETFLNGWRAAGEKCGGAWGRPADVEIGSDGAMYISDDAGGRVYRVVYTGP